MPTEVAPRLLTEQYTGDEVAFLAAVGGVLVDVDGNVLNFTLSDNPYSIQDGHWLVWSTNGSVPTVQDILPTAERAARYVEVPAAPNLG